MEGLGAFFSALPRKNSAEGKKSEESLLKPERVRALLSSVEEFRRTMPLDKAIEFATKFGKWGEGLPEDGSRDEYGALVRDYYIVELTQEFDAQEGRKAA